MKLVLFSLLYVCISLRCFAVDTVVYPWLGDDKYHYENYYYQLLKLALDKSIPKYGSYQLVQHKDPMNQGRAVGLIKHRKYVNVMWTMTSIDRENELNPIRIPLLKGLGGCRIFIINEGDQSIFDAIKSKKELQQLIAGQGDDWPDTTILRENGYRVMTGSSYNGVFQMLQKDRFDYFPRALHEPWSEISSFDGLVVENNFILEYPSPYYFFVGKGDVRLHDRIKNGLEVAMEDGSFDRFFSTHPATKGILEKVNFNNRTIYSLENSLLSDQSRKAFYNSKYSSVCKSNKKINHN